MLTWEQELVFALRVLAAAFLGSLLGWEREMAGRPAGIRTFAAVAMGACVFGLVGSIPMNFADPTRVAAQVASGIGFLGAGVIIRNKGQLRGLTTAATLWMSASIGLTMAFGLYYLGIISTIIALGMLRLSQFRAWQIVSTKRQRYERFEQGDSDENANQP